MPPGATATAGALIFLLGKRGGVPRRINGRKHSVHAPLNQRIVKVLDPIASSGRQVGLGERLDARLVKISKVTIDPVF
ncbi:hypothetical protein BGCPKDLD_1352 [Methylorubrum suomiense]|uniref:Uncharacterized protein n=1 Tax=Methylorubrum suomiense TaxID=144191 RepID=A0ABQ4URM2_9HYPH|nr:hypothetical protein BGCPKDLD_1352 [Methylorubrum suomiense]